MYKKVHASAVQTNRVRIHYERIKTVTTVKAIKTSSKMSYFSIKMSRFIII